MYNSGKPTNLLQEPQYISDSTSLVCWWRMGNYFEDVIKSGGGSSVATDNIITDISGNGRHMLPHTGWNGDEIVTTNAVGGDRKGHAANNDKQLLTPIVAPIALNNRGVPNLRNRDNAYKVTKG